MRWQEKFNCDFPKDACLDLDGEESRLYRQGALLAALHINGIPGKLTGVELDTDCSIADEEPFNGYIDTLRLARDFVKLGQWREEMPWMPEGDLRAVGFKDELYPSQKLVALKAVVAVDGIDALVAARELVAHMDDDEVIDRATVEILPIEGEIMIQYLLQSDEFDAGMHSEAFSMNSPEGQQLFLQTVSSLRREKESEADEATESPVADRPRG